ncbi:MAG: hypothetical protein QOJ11_2644 [Frankiales bacterium]|jgi:hypothetical protein|nr:hypothetical protein [Frankiales bacterium]
MTIGGREQGPSWAQPAAAKGLTAEMRLSRFLLVGEVVSVSDVAVSAGC